MRVCHVKIDNFRGIKRADFHMDEPMVCFVGAGDSAKSTLLDAIEYSLYPHWAPRFDDSDFFQCKTSHPIVIEVSVRDIPIELRTDLKYGRHLRGWNTKTKEIIDDHAENDELVDILTIRLTVDEYLEPTWHVVNDRLSEGIPISWRDRQRIRVFRIGSYARSEFSWRKGSTLSRLTDDSSEADRKVCEALRDMKNKANDGVASSFDEVLKTISTGHSEFGLKVGNLSAAVDAVGWNGDSSMLSLHQDGIPASRLGLGSSRLLSMSAQLRVVGEGGGVLVDEIESGLEAHRIRHMLRVLKLKAAEKTAGQVIFTTHHAAVLQELGCDPLFIVKKDNGGSVNVEKVPVEVQGTVRSMPDAILAPRVIVCEGATEVGLLRALEETLCRTDIKKSLAYNGVTVADALGGGEVKKRCEHLLVVGKSVCAFMDSDVSEAMPSESAGLKVIAWDGAVCTERRIIEDLSEDELRMFVQEIPALTGKTEGSIFDQIHSRLSGVTVSCLDHLFDACIADIACLRQGLFDSATAKEKEWFKNVGRGEALGSFLFDEKIYEAMKDTDFGKKIEMIKKWVAGD
jgi:hypothetical protein